MRFVTLRRIFALVLRRPGLALLICWPIAFIVTHIPRFGPLRDPPRHGLPLDKLAHVVGYMALAWLLALALGRICRFWLAAALTIVILGAYGVLDELTQPWVGRTADLMDYLADLVGCAAGIAVSRMPWQPDGDEAQPRIA